MLPRLVFCLLTKMEPERLKSLSRRDQLPFVGPEHPTLARGHNTYSPLEALLMIMADDLSQGGSLNATAAAQIVERVAMWLEPWWGEISASSLDLFEGRKPEAEILAGLGHLAMEPGHEASIPLVGDAKSIGAQIAGSDVPCLRVILANVSRAAAVLRMRAARHKIDLGDMWSA